MRGHIIENWYDAGEDFVDSNGQPQHLPSTAHIYKETKYGVFYGEAQAAPEDEDIANSWDGYRFAEMKCDIQAYKAKAKVMRERALGLQHACNVIAQANKGNIYNEIYMKFERQLQVAWNNYYRAQEQYETLKNMYYDYCNQIIRQRREFRNR